MEAIKVMCPECGEYHMVHPWDLEEVNNSEVCGKCLDKSHNEFIMDMAAIGLNYNFLSGDENFKNYRE